MPGLNYGLDPNQTFDTSSLMGPVAFNQSLMSYLGQLYGQPTDFGPSDRMFSSLMGPSLQLGPNGVMLDPRQTQATASSGWLTNRGQAAGEAQGARGNYQGMFGNLLGNYSGMLNNIQALQNRANAPIGGSLGIFSSLLGG